MPNPIERRVERLVSPLRDFVGDQLVASGLLLVCTVVAMVLANSAWAAEFEAIWKTTAGLRIGDWQLSMSLHHWINDGLMALFFFLLGLEMKRELLAGELQDARRARLLLVTALGGMVVPALMFYALCPADATRGWGIPMATDTAFAIGVLALLRSRVPSELATFLVGLAIIDDIGAVLVIALFYSDELSIPALAAAAALFGALVSANVLGFRRPWIYLTLGAGLWYAVLLAGVHATIAGVLVALTVPARPKVSHRSFEDRIGRLLKKVRRDREEEEGEPEILASPSRHEVVEAVRTTAKQATTPLQRWETALETPIGLLVLPLFALANAGIEIPLDSMAEALTDALIVAVASGLVVGKVVGITAFCWFGLRIGVGALPGSITLRHVAGLALLAGMGFTMSIFIANLAFSDRATLQVAKTGVVLGTLVAGVSGYLLLRFGAGRSADAD